MDPTLDTMHPLSRALEAAGITLSGFKKHFHGGAIERVLVASGELAQELTDPQRGRGAGQGGGRRVTGRATVCLAIGFRLMRAGIGADDAFRMALTFHALGEDGSGLRTLSAQPGAEPRPAGGLFASGRSYLVALPGVAEVRSDGPAFAFVPEADLTGELLTAWAGLHDADDAPIAVLDLTALVQELTAELARLAREDGSDDRG